MNPKVFISHCSEDKSRFVTTFATRLRENGVEAWLDGWEMLPGDSLVDKIFEEGLKDAQAVIIVLSNSSVASPWVTEELNASIVARISKGTKIIPVLIDDCDVPEVLKSTLWQRVPDPADFEDQLRQIVAAIFDIRDKPDVGEPPEFVRGAKDGIDGMASVDSLIFKRIVEYDLRYNSRILEPEKIFPDLKALGLSKQQILASIEVLDAEGIFKATHYIGGGPDSFGCRVRVTRLGFERYCSAELDNYEELKEQCAGLIVNEGVHDNETLASKTGTQPRLIDHILNMFKSNGLIATSEYSHGLISILCIHDKFRRMLS